MVREAVVSDFSAVYALSTQLFNMHLDARPDLFRARDNSWSEICFSNALKNPNIKFFVYEKDGIVLGYCKVEKGIINNNPKFRNDTVLTISEICVDEEKRGQKIGSRLFDKIKLYAKEVRVTTLEVQVWNFNNSAKSFYESMGMLARVISMELTIE